MSKPNSTYNYLVDHARKNVWCSPRQDYQAIIDPARLTGSQGAAKIFRVMWNNLAMPDETSRWHVYQIGGVHPIIFNLFAKCYTWVSLAEACNTKAMVANIYTASGVELTKYDTFYRYTPNNELILAVKIDKRFPVDFAKEKIYLRLYSNAHFSDPAQAILTKKVFVQGRVVETAGNMSQMKNVFLNHKPMAGKTILYVNGFAFDDWDDANVKLMDKVEVVYDAAVKKVITLSIRDLNVFESDLDSVLKYLIHYNDVDPGMIDFYDDIDFRVQQPWGTTTRSVYYNRNEPNSVRQLTHRDYSLVTSYVKRYSETLANGLPAGTTVEPHALDIQLIIRHGGWKRPLVFEHARIHELYKMKDEDVVRAMAGLDAVVPVWTAPYLEQSTYTQIMRAMCCDIDNPMVEDAYGYNAISKILADTPSKPIDVNGEIGVNVPWKLQLGATAYEYDVDGLLIGFYHHYLGPFYKTRHPETEYVEMVAGFGSATIDERNGKLITGLNMDHSYRVYVCKAVGGKPDNKWVDVTDTDRYTLDNGTFTWLSDNPVEYPMLRSDRKFLARTFNLSMDRGFLKFTLQQQKANNQGLLAEKNMDIPMGQLDLFLNSRSLIRDLDYFVVFPDVYIVNKKYLKRPLASEQQQVHVRFMGHPYANMDMVEEGNCGFIEHGVLSNNSRYDIRDDKVLRIVVDGGLKTRDDMIFSEFHSGVSVVDALNGMPYMVKDVLVPVNSDTVADTYALRTKSKEIDKQVSEYLTLKIPQPDRSAPSAIPNRYPLYSPFFNKLIMDLKYEDLILPHVTGGLTRQNVLEICKPYEYLLKVDPSQTVRRQDANFVVIHPHALDIVVTLKQPHYQFMQQVMLYYGNDLVDLHTMLRIE